MKTKSFATTNPSDFRTLKQKLNTAFRGIRTRNVLAYQSFMCCMSCALAALPEDPSATGIVYYHRQDADNLRDYGELMVRFTPFERPDAPSGEVVGRIAVECLRNAGLATKWNGTDGQAIHVRMK